MRKAGLLFLVFAAVLILQCKSGNDDKNLVPLLSIDESINDLEIENGFIIEPVCAEPLIEDPVALSFDEDGAMWVVELRGYMHDTEGEGENQPLGRIKVVKDKNEDGRYDSSYIFLDSLIMPRAVAVVKGGILLIEPPALLFIENKNGKAGNKTIIDSAFAITGNVEHQPNGLLRGIDNWYYCGTSNKRVRNINGKWVVENTRLRGQWGISKDDAGRLFYNNNSVILMADNFLPGSFITNPNHRSISGRFTSARMTENRVYPRRPTTGVNRGYQQGVLDKDGKLINVTSACGPVIYRGDNFPEEYYGNAFVMEPAAYLMKRVLLSENDNGLLMGEFAYTNKEFLTATDERFRPVSGYTSPDGCLYVIDMHRGVIQHTTYMTPYLRRHIDSLQLERPIGMGRIYRIRWKEKQAGKTLKLSAYSSVQLVELLKYPNGYYRDMAQRLLCEKNDTSASDELLKLALDNSNPIGVLHAIWILESMNRIDIKFIRSLLATHQNDRAVYQSCLELLGKMKDRPEAFRTYASSRKKGNRFAEVCFLNGLYAFKKDHGKEIEKIVSEIVPVYKNDPLLTDAVLNIAGELEKNFLKNVENSGDSILIQALNAAIKRSQEPKEEDAIAHLNHAEKDMYFSGKSYFQSYCATCHGKDGEGMLNIAPPLAGSEWVNGDEDVTIKILLDGMNGPVSVNGTQYAPPAYANTMPGLRNNISSNNGEIAGVITYIRNAFGNKGSAVTVEKVGKIRSTTENRVYPYKAEELTKRN